MDEWLIIDSDGIIDSGPEDDLRTTFDGYRSGALKLDWEGDLLLVQVHERHR